MSGFDFESIESCASTSAPVDPIDIFTALQPKNPDLKGLWFEQGDALRVWHASYRNESDVAILLNTGAGKTLVGLLCAQSLINEAPRKVMYLCSTVQLVDQTAEKAEQYGVPVTVYKGGEFSNDLYAEGRGACITTYAAIFNGLAKKFRNDQPSAYIFDDAHTAEHIIRGQYTLRIGREKKATVHGVFALFRPYFASMQRVTRFDELASGTVSGFVCSFGRTLLGPALAALHRRDQLQALG